MPEDLPRAYHFSTYKRGTAEQRFFKTCSTSCTLRHFTSNFLAKFQDNHATRAAQRSIEMKLCGAGTAPTHLPDHAINNLLDL
jgi:hypothetical protein